MPEDRYRDILAYHNETKHHYHRYARSPGYMDWANQPVPFRQYNNTESIRLPLLTKNPDTVHSDLYRRDDSAPSPITLETIGGMLELSLGLSAWKVSGDARWALRMNPSSGNLHPTEAHLLLPPMGARDPGVYHYNPYAHALECRAVVPDTVWAAIEMPPPAPGFLVILSSIFWREAWKYGERAFRYCNHDTGHALAGLSIAAGLFGWQVSVLSDMSDDDIDRVAGFDRVEWHGIEQEEAELICAVHSPGPGPRKLPEQVVSQFNDIDFVGAPNRLSRETITWETIYRAARATRKPRAETEFFSLAEVPFLDGCPDAPTPSETIRQRRSAVSFDGSATMNKTAFFSILDKTRARKGCSPFDSSPAGPRLHLLLFVHRVDGLAPGLYLFVRNDGDLERLKETTRPGFLWHQVRSDFPLYSLEPGDLRQTATMVSCHQDIAGSSVFSLGMLARFSDIVQPEPWQYRRLFWESGMIGQVLYLEAEACGFRGTGIGCFFDDAVHELAGITDASFQSIYHFTIGKPVEDPRLGTLPPYHHLT